MEERSHSVSAQPLNVAKKPQQINVLNDDDDDDTNEEYNSFVIIFEAIAAG